MRSMVSAARRGLRRLRSQGGNVATIFALIAPVISIIMAIGVDLGAVSVQRRELQAVTDLAAIVAAGDLDAAEKRAMTLLSENGISDIQALPQGVSFAEAGLSSTGATWVEVVRGHYLPDHRLKPADRFVPGETPYNAVRVTVARPGGFFIMSGIVDAPFLKTSGVAHASAEAAFSVGSRLVRVEEGVLNALLSSLLGSQINLRVMDYEALIRGRVSLLPVLDTLGTNLNLTAASYNDILDTGITVSQLAAAIRQSGSLDAQARAALSRIESSPGAAATRIRPADAIDLGATVGRLGPHSTQPGPVLNAPVMELLTSAITASNGEHQATLDLGAAVPGLLKTSIELRIGERPQQSPWLRLSGPNAIVSTAQTRLKVSVEVPGTALLAGSTVRIPLYVDVAAADAKLATIACRADRSGAALVKVAAQPAVGRVMIGEVARNDFAQLGRTMNVARTKVVDTKLLAVRARANVQIGNQRSTELSFSQADIDAGRAKTATTRNYTSSLLGSALRDLDLQVDAGPLSLATPSLVQAALAAALTPALEPVDNVVYNLLTALGVHLGEADIRVHGVTCQAPVLVQ